MDAPRDHILGADLRIDAGRRIIHSVRNRTAERKGGNGNGRADDGQNQRIFGRRGAAIVANHFNEGFHVPSPNLSLRPPAPEGTDFKCLTPGEAVEGSAAKQAKRAGHTIFFSRPPGRLTRGNCGELNFLSSMLV